DPRAVPEYKERVPYVITYGTPKQRLIDVAVPPQELVSNPNLLLNGKYYIKKQLIPPLTRVFNLIGFDIEKIYEDMPKVNRAIKFYESGKAEKESKNEEEKKKKKKFTIDEFYDAKYCDKVAGMLNLTMKIRKYEESLEKCVKTCKLCSGYFDDFNIECDSVDCPVYFKREKSLKKYGFSLELKKIIEKL
ncbi:DNA polymerase zeta, partial [Clydaea vesicula]